MFGFLKRLLASGSVEERLHPLFGRMWFWPSADGTGYWEAEPTLHGHGIGATFNAGSEGPSPEQERFLEWAEAEADALFELARPALVPEYERWTQQPFPVTWRDAFVVSGLEIPDAGDPANPWSLAYDCLTDPAGHQFRTHFEDGHPVRVEIDG